MVLCLRFTRVAAVPVRVPTCSIGEEMSANGVVFFARFVGEEMFPSWFESTPAVKIPSAVVRPVSHIPSFGGHCCPGISKTRTSR